MLALALCALPRCDLLDGWTAAHSIPHPVALPLCRRAHAHRVQDTADDRVRGTPLDGTSLGGLLLLHQLYGLVVARRMEAVLVELGHLVAQLLDLPLKAALAEV